MLFCRFTKYWYSFHARIGSKMHTVKMLWGQQRINPITSNLVHRTQTLHRSMQTMLCYQHILCRKQMNRIDKNVHNEGYQMQDNCVCRQTHTYPHHTQLNLNIASADISGSPLNQSHGNILLLLPSCRRARVCRVVDPATTCLLIDNYLTRLWVNNMPR